MWFIGFGIILINFVVVLALGARYSDVNLIKVANKTYWIILGIWDIVYGFFIDSEKSFYYIPFGLICILVGLFLFIKDCFKEKEL